MECRLSQMILDKKLHGIVDQGSGCLIIFAEPKDNVRGALSAPFSPALYANAPSRLLYFCFRSHVSAENLHRGAADHEQHEQGHGLAVQAHRKAFLDRLLLANLCGPVPATKMRCVHGLHHRLYKGVVGRHESQRVRHGSDGPLMQRRRSFQVVQPELKPDPGQPDVCEQRTNRPGFVSDVQGTVWHWCSAGHAQRHRPGSAGATESRASNSLPICATSTGTDAASRSMHRFQKLSG